MTPALLWGCTPWLARSQATQAGTLLHLHAERSIVQRVKGCSSEEWTGTGPLPFMDLVVFKYV